MEERKKIIYDNLREGAKLRGKYAEFVSFSKLDKYKQCPHMYKLMYKDKIKTDMRSPYGVIGTLTHDLTENTFKSKLNQGDRCKIFNDEMKKICESFELGHDFPLFKSLKHYFQKSKLLSYLEKGLGNIEFEVPVYFKLKDTEKKEVWFVGFIDMVVHKGNDIVEIYDFKTSNKSSYTGSKLDEALYQLYIYAYAYGRQYKKTVTNIAYLFLKYVDIHFKNDKGRNTKNSWIERKDIKEFVLEKGIDNIISVEDKVMKIEYLDDEGVSRHNDIIDLYTTIANDDKYEGKDEKDYFCSTFCEYRNGICTWEGKQCVGNEMLNIINSMLTNK